MLVPRFAVTGRAVAAADGTATVIVNGPPAWWRYDISSVVITSTAARDDTYPTAAVYRGAITTPTLLGQSRSADRVTFAGQFGDVLQPGENLIVVMAFCLAGSTIVCNMFGEQVAIS